jgi:hypothetical protein
MLAYHCEIESTSPAFVMPLLPTAGRTRIRFRSVADPHELLPADWEQPTGPLMVVVAA